MNEYFFNVNFEKGKIKTDLKELVQNDYNSTKINFTFDKEGRVLFKLKFPDGTSYVDDIENNEYILTPGILSQSGDYEIEISLYTTDGRLTDYAIANFYVRAELVNENEIAELDDRIPVLSNLINEVENIDIDAEKVGNTSTVTVINKYGEEKTVEIKDGEKGEKGDCNFATFEVNNNMELVMNKTDDMLLEFSLNENNELEVII